MVQARGWKPTNQLKLSFAPKPKHELDPGQCVDFKVHVANAPCAEKSTRCYLLGNTNMFDSRV